jgi:hypothetical protein
MWKMKYDSWRLLRAVVEKIWGMFGRDNEEN